MTAFEPPAEPTAMDTTPRVQVRTLTAETEHRDQLLAKLHRGITIPDSFAAIAFTVATESAVDRVSMLRIQFSRCILVATSTQPHVDRRSRQSRLLERLATQVVTKGSSLTYELGAGTTSQTISPELEAYLSESGTRELHIECVEDPDTREPVAVVVLERFRVLEHTKIPIQTLLTTLRSPLAQATANALERDHGIWNAIVQRWTRVTVLRRTWAAVIIATISILAGVFVPVDLEIAVVGTIAATHKRHVFSSQDGVVTSVLVQGGDNVVAGQPLMTIRSSSLELLEQSVQASLATTQARLDALLALRGRDRQANMSVDEQSLRTEIAGLQTQAEILLRERGELTVKSPIDGRIDGWELRQAFESRPVSRGQFLMDVVTPNAGWTVELDIPDQQMGYVLAAQKTSPCLCRIRVRSDATITYNGILEEIDNVAQLNARSESVVRAKVKLVSNEQQSIRNGATVVAQVNCGPHSLGFVCFRGVVQWWRGLSW